MSPRFVLGRENVPRVAEVVNRLFKADCTDFTYIGGTSTKGSGTVTKPGGTGTKPCLFAT